MLDDEAGLGRVFTAELYAFVTQVTRRDGAALHVTRDGWAVKATITSASTAQALPFSVDIITGRRLAFVLPIRGMRSAPQSAVGAAYSLFERLVEIQ